MALLLELKIPKKYLWTFWGASIALALAHLFFHPQGEAQTHAQECLKIQNTLVELETNASVLENDVTARLSSPQLDLSVKEDLERIQTEIAELNEQILISYIEPDKKHEGARSLRKRLTELQEKSAALFEKDDRLLLLRPIGEVSDEILFAIAKIRNQESRAELIDLFRTQGLYRMEFTPEAMRTIVDAYSGDAPLKLQGQVKKAVVLISNDPSHPSLKTHLLDKQTVYRAMRKEGILMQTSVVSDGAGGHRLLWYHGSEKGQITIFKLIHHDDY